MNGQSGRSVSVRRIGVAAFLLGISCIAFAADEPAGSQNAAPKGVEELVITAQRRTEDLQTTAVAATVLTGDDLKDKSVYGLTAVQYAAPSVTISDYGSANVFNIRGIGRSQVDVELPSGVVIYQDGAPTLAGYFQNEPYFDMAGIEVLRGPQGTFSGKSAAGGALFIRTRSPELHETSGNVEAGFGNFDQRELTGVANVPLGDTAAVRIAVHKFERDDYYGNLSGDYSGHPGDQDLDSVRIGLRWQPMDELNVVLKADVSDLDFGGNVTTSPGHSLFNDIEQNANFKYSDRSVRTVLNVDYQFGNGLTVTSLTGYQKLKTFNNLDANATQPDISIFDSQGKVDIWSQEFNLISPEDQRLTWVVGVFGQQQRLDVPSWQAGGFTFTQLQPFAPLFFGEPAGLAFPWFTSPIEQQTDDLAAFAQVGFHITDALELDLGARYSYYQLNQHLFITWGSGSSAPIVPFPGTGPGLNSQEMSETSTDWKASLNWTLSQDHFLYGLVSRGHVVGGINLLPPMLPWSDMSVINYELGWKANWFDNQLHTQFDGYYETFDDYQAQFGELGPVTSSNSLAVFRNAQGSSTIWGFEFSAQAVFGNLSVDVGAGYLDSELGTFKNVINPFLPPPDNIVDLSGAKSPFSPKWTGNVGASYAISLPGNLRLIPRIDYSYIDSTQAGLWNSSLITLEDRKLLNAQLRLESDKWYVNLWSTNATDEKYVGGIQNDAALYYAAPPRMYGMRVGMSF